MAGKGSENPPLTAKQEAAALALAAGSTVSEAATACGCGERTVARWLAELPQLQERISQLKAEMTSRALGKMTDGMACAADTLVELLSSEKDSVRLGASRALLELTVKLRESTELEARIRALEEQGRGKTP